MRTLVLDLETRPCPELPPLEDPDIFPNPIRHQIVAFGALGWGSTGPFTLRCLGDTGLDDEDAYEQSALRELAGILAQHQTQIIGWNSRRFDLPVIVARSLRWAIPQPTYLREGRAWEQYTYRYGTDLHWDLKDWLSGYGAGDRLHLDEAAKLCGGQGKTDTEGSMVAELWAKGERDRVRGYCLDDVADTARVWLRCKLLRGDFDESEHERQVEQLRVFNAERVVG